MHNTRLINVEKGIEKDDHIEEREIEENDEEKIMKEEDNNL